VADPHTFTCELQFDHHAQLQEREYFVIILLSAEFRLPVSAPSMFEDEDSRDVATEVGII